MLQELEAKRLIGSVMSVATETGEDWIHLAFFNERDALEVTDDGIETKVVLGRPVALSLVALLRVALAEFELLHAQSATVCRPNRDDGVVVTAVASQHSLVVTWQSGVTGVRCRKVDEPGQGHLEVRVDIATAIEDALVKSLARLAVGPGP